MATIKRYIYAFDPTGRLEANLIRNERHTITPENRTPQNVLIPGFAPYFRQSLIVTDIHTGRPLQEGIDYTCEWPVLSTADNTEGYTPLYGGIQFIDNAITGQFELQYQTIGGQYALDGVTIAQALANQANDPLTTTYEDIIGRPLKLPPLEHVHSIEDFVGFEDLCREIVLLKEAIELLAREDRDSHPGYDTLVDSYFRLELLMEQNKEAIQTLAEDTKNKLQEVRDDLTSLINQTKNNLEDRINQVNNTLTQDLNTAKTELSNAIQQLNTNLTKLINTLRTDFDAFVKGTFYPATGEKAQDVNKFFNDTKNGFINGDANVTDSRSPTLGVLATLPNGTYDYTGITTTSGGQTTQLISLGETYHYFRTKDTAGNDWYNELIVTNDNIDRVLKGLGNVVFTTTNQDVDGLKTFLKELKVKYSGTNPNYTGSLLRMGVNDVGAYLVNSTTNHIFNLSHKGYPTYANRKIPLESGNYISSDGKLHTAYTGLQILRQVEPTPDNFLTEQYWRVEAEPYSVGNRLKFSRSAYAKHSSNPDSTINNDNNDDRKNAININLPNASGEVVLNNHPVRLGTGGGSWISQHSSGAPLLVGKQSDLDHSYYNLTNRYFYPVLKTIYTSVASGVEKTPKAAWSLGLLKLTDNVGDLASHFAIAYSNNNQTDNSSSENNQSFLFKPEIAAISNNYGGWEVKRSLISGSEGLQLNNYKPGVSNKYLLLKDNGEVQTHLGQVVHSNDSYILGPRVSATSWTGVNLFIDNQGFKYEVNPATRTFKLRREAVTGGKGAIDIDFQDKTGIVALLSDLTPFATTTITTGIRNDLNALTTEVGGLGTSLASNYVTLNTDQTITGSKMFKRAVHINIDGQAKGQLTLTQDHGALIHANGSTQNTHIRLTDDGYIDFHATNLNDDTSGGGGIRLAGDGALVLTKGIQDGRKVILMSDVSVNDIYIRSDKRLKENIEPIDNGLETILNLKGRTFDWKGSGRHAAGFIAQEVAEANRDLVSCASDEQKTMSVNYVDIIAYLVEAVKTQQKQIDELSNEIKSLKQQ